MFGWCSWKLFRLVDFAGKLRKSHSDCGIGSGAQFSPFALVNKCGEPGLDPGGQPFRHLSTNRRTCAGSSPKSKVLAQSAAFEFSPVTQRNSKYFGLASGRIPTLISVLLLVSEGKRIAEEHDESGYKGARIPSRS